MEIEEREADGEKREASSSRAPGRGVVGAVVRVCRSGCHAGTWAAQRRAQSTPRSSRTVAALAGAPAFDWDRAFARALHALINGLTREAT